MAPELLLAVAFAAVVIVGSYAWVFARGAVKRRRLAATLARLRGEIAARGAEPVDDERFRWKGRVYRLTGNINPLFGANLSLRLSLYAPGDIEFQMKRAAHVPAPPQPGLASDEFYRAFAFEGTVTPEVERFLLDERVKAALLDRLGRSWEAYSQFYVERVLFQNAFDYREYDGEALLFDLAALETLAAVPLGRRFEGGTWTIRHGFEERPWPWHWRPEQRLLLPPKLVRFLVSAYAGHPFVTAPLWEFLRELAGPDDLAILTDDAPPELAFTFPSGHHADDTRVYVEDPQVVAGLDPFTDGRFVQAIVAVPRSGREMLARAYRGAARRDFHDISLGLLDKLAFYVRRLYDDEFSWLSGEYEVLTTQRTLDRCERGARAVAERHRAKVVEITQPFLPKLLKSDRLEVTV